MAPISSGSSTWTSSGIHFSIVSMATGMGPSSSGSQATVASVVTSTLLAGLGVSGGVISSLPSSVGTTQAPRTTQSSARPTAPLAKPGPEQTPAATTPKEADTQAEDTQTTREGEGSEGEEEEKDKEKDEDGEGEQDESESEKKAKSKAARGDATGQSNSTAAEEPTAPTPASTAKQKGGGTPTAPAATSSFTTTAAASATGQDEQLVREQSNHTEVVGEPTTLQPHNDSAEMQIPQSSTLAPKVSGEDHKLWPFSVHTGELQH